MTHLSFAKNTECMVGNFGNTRSSEMNTLTFVIGLASLHSFLMYKIQQIIHQEKGKLYMYVIRIILEYCCIHWSHIFLCLKYVTRIYSRSCTDTVNPMWAMGLCTGRNIAIFPYDMPKFTQMFENSCM